MPDTIVAEVATINKRDISWENEASADPAGTVFEIKKDGVTLATYTVPEGQTFSGNVMISGSESAV